MSHPNPPSTVTQAGTACERSAHAPVHPWYRSHHLHHLGVALTVACLVGFLHHAGYLGWLDAAMLRLTGATVRADPARVQRQHMPEVLLISEALYADRFKLSSPLPREALAQLLTQLFKPGTADQVVPKALVFDIDLSDNGTDQDGQAVLDGVLKTLGERGTRLILPMPLPTHLPALQQAKRAWMEKVCQWEAIPPVADKLPPDQPPPLTVRLVSAQVDTHGGQVLQYNTRLNTLGTVAANPDRAPDGCGLRPEQKAVHLTTLTQPHADPLALPGDKKFQPYQQGFFAAADQHTHRLGRDGRPQSDTGVPVALAGKVVFIGGDYDSRDRMLSPWFGVDQAMPGVLVHAAAFYSERQPLTSRPWIDFLVDVFVGFLAGTLFQSMWCLYHRFDTAERTHRIGGYLRAKCLFLLIPAVALLLAMALVWVSAQWLYPGGHWVSPGPVVLGVALKVLLSSGRERHHSVPVLVLQGLALVALLALYLPQLFH